jgi:hypothetical protein
MTARRTRFAVASDTFPVVQAALVVLAAGGVPGVLFALVTAFGYDVPWADEWDWLLPIVAVHHGASSYYNIFSAQTESVLRHFWDTHNEHRIFLPSLLATALSFLGGWSPKREALIGVAIVTCELALLWRMLRATIGGRVLAPAFAAAAVVLFSLTQAENWVWGYQIAWFAGTALALASTFTLSRPRLSRARVAIAFGASAGAALSSAFGLVSPIVGLAVLLLRRDASRVQRIAWALATAALGLVYFAGYPFGNGVESHARGAGALPEIVTYAVAYLGSLPGAWSGLILATVFGCAGLALYASAAVRYAQLRHAGNALADAYLTWLAVGAFGLVDAFVTAYGRIGWGIGSALQSRYTTVTAGFWVALFALSILLSRDAGATLPARRNAVRAIAVLAAAAFVACFVRAEAQGYAAMADAHARVQSDVRALYHLRSASDADIVDLYSPSVDQARVAVKLLTLAGLGPLASEPALAFTGRGDEPSFGALWTFAELSGDALRNVTGGVRRGARIDAAGWACDEVTLAPGASVVALVDGRAPRQSTRYHLPTPGVAAGLFRPELANAGFDAVIDTSPLSVGQHAFEIVLRTADGTQHALRNSRRTVTIAAAPEQPG